MSYPTLTSRAADRVVDSLASGADEDELREYLVMADGPRLHETTIFDAADRARKEWVGEKTARDERGAGHDVYLLEAFMSSRIHRATRELPIDLLEDFGFWRYLGLFPYRWYMQEREGGPDGLEVKPQDFGGTAEKKDESGGRTDASPTYHLILRTFLWGKVAFDASEPDPYRRAMLVNDTGGAVTDVWHSHIVRIQLGQLGRLPHAFLDSICDEPRANDKDGGRLVEKRLTRMKHSVLFDVYDLDGARALADEQKALALKRAPGTTIS